MSEFKESISITTNPKKVWEALSDIGNIYLWNPGVVHSELTSTGNIDIGASRYCDLGNNNYLDEELVEFQKPTKLTFRIANTNLPFKTADIRFSIEQQGNNNTVVTVSPKYRLKFGWIGLFLDSIMVRQQYRKGMRGLLSGLKDYVEQPESHVREKI